MTNHWHKYLNSSVKPPDLLYNCDVQAPPIDPFQIAQIMQVSISESTPSNPDSSVNVGDDKASIFIDCSNRASKQRMSCAIGLARIILPLDNETLCTRYAVELLMPEYWVRAFRTIVADYALYEIFGVSENAMSLRLTML